jgi:hypothetical protein
MLCTVFRTVGSNPTLSASFASRSSFESPSDGPPSRVEFEGAGDEERSVRASDRTTACTASGMAGYSAAW